MTNQSNPIDKFNFLLGKWKLIYKVPKSSFSDADEGEGTGEFKRVLNDKYVTFDYSAKLHAGEGSAHAIFVWDEKANLYRYWWFEDSGSFMTASCNFINEDTLCLNWHNSLLVQTFKRETNDRIILKMSYPSDDNSYDVILEVTFIKVNK
jgi:L-rhamnose mutarotase